MGRGDSEPRRVYGSIVLDSEGLNRAAQSDRAVGVTLAVAERTETPVVVSAVTLTEVLRGRRRDAGVHRALKACRVEPVTSEIGRAAGELLGRTGRSDTVDAVVVGTAAGQVRPTLIVTSDPDDFGALTAEMKDVLLRVV